MRYQSLSWQSARKFVYQLNSELATIIDRLNPDESFPLIRMEYDFGDIIVDRGQFYLPSLLKTREETLLRSQLLYASIPLGIVISNAAEVFVDTSHRIVPLNLICAGDLFGVFETTNYLFGKKETLPTWSVSAGARTLFMLPKITDITGFKKLRAEFDLSISDRVKELSDHWLLFKKIVKHKNFSLSWKCEILFFTKKWFDMEPHSQWLELYHYLYKKYWSQSQYAIKKVDFSLNWQLFMEAITRRHLKPDPYISDTIKHLFLISSSNTPGLIPAGNDDQVGPFQALQEAFVHVYGLKKHFPTLMHVNALHTLAAHKSVYYSLFYPTIPEGFPYKRLYSTIMQDIREIKFLLDTYEAHIKNFKDNQVVSKIKFSYFHTEKDIYKEINSANLLEKEDSRLSFKNKENWPLTFCASSQFWKGCIKIEML